MNDIRTARTKPQIESFAADQEFLTEAIVAASKMRVSRSEFYRNAIREKIRSVSDDRRRACQGTRALVNNGVIRETTTMPVSKVEPA